MSANMIRFTFLVVALCAAVSLAHPTTTASIVVVDTTDADVATTSLEVQDITINTDVPDNAKPMKEVRFPTKHLKPKITSMHVESNVTLRYAKTLVTSRVSNPASKANEITFSVVIPETAFITGFSMEIDGKVYQAYVKEKAEAKKVYQAAVNSGISAAHVAVQARDSNHFTVSVNVEPESKAIFRLTYEELLTRRLGLYNLVMNINPGQLLDDLSVDVNIDESAAIKELFVPQLRTGNEVDAEPTDASNEYSTHKLSDDKLHAKVHFSPNKTQQLELMKIFKERERQTTTPSNYYNYDPRPSKTTVDEEGLKGQFVVQYDVDRDVKGEVLLNDGYFVHFFAPNDLKPLNKHVIFVLDVSGSMVGRKVAQLKEAMNSILQDLNPGDYFSIIDFSYNARVYDLDNPAKNALYHHQNDRYYFGEEVEAVKREPEAPPPPKPATPENIAKAKLIIDQLVATGGTNIHDALTTALKVANLGIITSKKESETPNKKPLPSPMIIFLTDGEPTVGDTNLENILKAVSDLNTMKVALFSLAFGEDADRTFLRRVSLQNSGFMRHIYEAADAAQQLRHFYKQVASPLLANVTLTYPKDQIDEETLTKKSFKFFFLGSELVIAGRTKNKEVVDSGLTLHANSYDGPIDFIPIVPREEKRTNFWPLERMWAYLTIKQLLDEKDSKAEKSSEDSADPNVPSNKALQLALKYSFVTPLTSLVVVKPNSTAAVDAESVEAGGAPIGGNYALPLIGLSGAPMMPASYISSMPFPVSSMANSNYLSFSRPLMMPAYASHKSSMSYPVAYRSMANANSLSFYRPRTVALPGKPQPLWLSPAAAVGFYSHSNDQQNRPDQQSLNVAHRTYSVPVAHHSLAQSFLAFDSPAPLFASSAGSVAGLAGSIDRADPDHRHQLIQTTTRGHDALDSRVGITLAHRHKARKSPRRRLSMPQAQAGSSYGGYSGDRIFGGPFGSVGAPSLSPGPPGPPAYDTESLSSYDESDSIVESLSTPIAYTTEESLKVESEITTESIAEEATHDTNATSTKTPADKLKLYGLEAYPWVAEYLNEDNQRISLPMPAESPSTYMLKVKSITYPATVEKPCTNSIGGGAGSCKYLTDCAELATGFKDFATYLNHSCDAQGFAGICCKLPAPLQAPVQAP